MEDTNENAEGKGDGCYYGGREGKKRRKRQMRKQRGNERAAKEGKKTRDTGQKKSKIMKAIKDLTDLRKLLLYRDWKNNSLAARVRGKERNPCPFKIKSIFYYIFPVAF